MAKREYTPAERERACLRAKEIGPTRAGRELGIPPSTIATWQQGRAPGQRVEPEAKPPLVKGKKQTSPPKRTAKTYTPSQRAQALEYAAAEGITAAARKLGMTRFSIYSWQRQAQLHAEGKVPDSPVVGGGEDRVAGRDHRILTEWKAHPGLGPSQVRNQLRRQGFKVSLHTVRCLLEKNGYVTPRVRRLVGDHEQRYEAVRPNQLWHLDFLHRHVHKQKVYILILLDDWSRFIVGGALWDGERVAAVQETFQASVSRHGKPEMAMSDGGSAFYSWRGVGAFTRLLEELEVDQIIAKTPQANGKLEVLNANLQKELFNQEVFFDLGEAQRRLAAWISFYNLRRTHHALGGLLVPADRYFGRAEEVLAHIEAGHNPDGLGEPIPASQRQLDLLRLSSCRGQLELHLLGHRVSLPVSNP